MGDDDDGDTQSSRTSSWAVKQEPPPRTGPQSWYPLADVSSYVMPAAVSYQVLSAPPFAAAAASLPAETTELQLSVKPVNLEQAPNSNAAVSNVTWAAAAAAAFGSSQIPAAAPLPVREPERCSKTLPSWLTGSKLGDVAPTSLAGSGKPMLPTTSLNNDPPAQPWSLWKNSEQDKGTNPPPLDHPCKLFGFNLADKAVSLPVSSAPSHCDDSEDSGPWPATDHSSPLSVVDQQASKVATGTYSTPAAPVRSGTKVRFTFWSCHYLYYYFFTVLYYETSMLLRL